MCPCREYVTSQLPPPRSISSSAAGEPQDVAEDASGWVLGIYKATISNVASGFTAQWVHSSIGAGPEFTLPLTAQSVQVSPLGSGGVAVRADGSWAGVLNPGVRQLDPAPQWLIDRPQTTFALVRGQTAYAVTRPDSNVVDLVASTGTFCGSATFPGVERVDVGMDGTVIGSAGCRKSWWPALLK